MIIPVLDIKKGLAVSGKSGKRETYTPLKTIFHNSSDPYEISKKFKKKGALRIYIADLDAIDEKGSNSEIIEKINNKIPVMLDAGISNFQEFEDASKIADKVIVATETLRSIKYLDEIFRSFNKNKIILSIDIINNQILSKYANFDCKTIIKKINELKPYEVILLDISRVGTEKGFDVKLINKFLGLETSIIVGGGITKTDIDVLGKLGVEKILVGSALHKGKLGNYLHFH
ncbi:MAG: HisA/HisF family protein [Euryarchaeota archaeon]|nr:HisA/HisF family protein [Euryarchaeota archaeon]